MRKKCFNAGYLVIIAVIVASFLSMRHADKGSSYEDESLANVKRKGVFVIGLDDSFPPMGYRDESNNIVGFDVELAEEVAKRMSVKFKAQPIDWDAKEMEISSGNIDCIWNGFTITDERRKNLLFSNPYLDNEQVILVTKDGGITSDSQLSGKIIGMQAGSSGAESYEASSLKDVNSAVEYKDFLIAIMDLRAGAIDALVIDSIVAGEQMRTSGASDELRLIRSSRLPSEQYGIGFRKGDVALRDEVQKHVDSIIADGTFARIADKYGIVL